MNDSPTPAAESAQPGHPADGRFDGRDDFRERLRQAFEAASREHWRQMIWCDADFEDWPLGELAVIEMLNHWAQAGRQLLLLACRFEPLTVRHARFVRWRRDWSHIVEARACTHADPLDFPSALWSPAWALQRHDPIRSVGWSGREAERRLLLHENLQEWRHRSTPAFPATTLGL